MTHHFVELEGGLVIETEDLRLWPDAKRLSTAEGKRRRKERAREALLGLLTPGATIYTCLRSVSSSGMSRQISVHIATERDGKPEIHRLTGYVADLCGFRRSKDGSALVVSGAGMDMGFHVVYTLGHYLWPEGTPKPHSTRNGEPDSDGGYALRHEWL